MASIHSYKKYIWDMLKKGEWATETLLSKNNKTRNKNWNKAISDAQQWVRLNLIKRHASSLTPKMVVQNNAPLRKPNTKTVAVKALDKRKKQMSRSRALKNRDNFRSANTFSKPSYKRYIDEGIAGTRDDNKKMRGRQSCRNKSSKV